MRINITGNWITLHIGRHSIQGHVDTILDGLSADYQRDVMQAINLHRMAAKNG